MPVDIFGEFYSFALFHHVNLNKVLHKLYHKYMIYININGFIVFSYSLLFYNYFIQMSKLYHPKGIS